MKIRNLLVLGLAAFTLASCGGPKKYKNLVDAETFLKKMENALTEKGMYGFEQTFSYLYEGESETERKRSDIYDGKKLNTYEETSKIEFEKKYDSSNLVLEVETESKTKSEDAENESKSSKESHIKYQCDENKFYSVNLNLKTYSGTELLNPSTYVDSQAYRELEEITYYLYNAGYMVMSPDVQCYIDDDLYTVVLESENDDRYSSEKNYSLIQIEITEGKLEFYAETYEFYSNETYESERTFTEKITLKKKDVSLKKENLSKYTSLGRI